MQDEAERQRQGAASLRKFLQMQQAAGLAVPGMEMLAQIAQPPAPNPASSTGTNNRKDCGAPLPHPDPKTMQPSKVQDAATEPVLEASSDAPEARAQAGQRTDGDEAGMTGVTTDSAARIMGPQGEAVANLCGRQAMDEESVPICRKACLMGCAVLYAYMGRSSSSESTSKAAKKKGDKKAKKSSKKEAKKAKKEAKKAKKLAKQIKKLEEEVEKRKRQIKGEVEGKKKKKKSSSSSSSSSSKQQKKGSNKPPEPAAETEEHWEHRQLPESLSQPAQPGPLVYSETQSPPKSPQSPRSEKERSPPESSSEESNPEIHEGAVCDHCDMQPILGPRFKCASCDDVSLCKKCYKRRQEIHRPSHRFFAMKPMKSDQPIQPIQPHSPRPLAERADSGEPQELLAAGRAPRAEQYPEAPTPNTNVAPVSVSAPMIVPAVAQEVASQMQERFLNMGKGYAKSWQESLPVLEDPAAKKHTKVSKPEPITKVGKQMNRGAACGLCLQQVPETASGVLCFRVRPDGTEAGCSKSVCFPCMARASSVMFGKVRVNKEIWMAMGAQAWWMHERCMTSEEVVEHAELVKSTGLEETLKASKKLPKGWVSKISKTTGKVYYVNAKKSKTQWTLPEEEVEETQEHSQQVTANLKEHESPAEGGQQDVKSHAGQEELTEL
ncbi:HERC2 [Symbiodinium natans]|uniref:HERC2 protein n=1 Tax=Symbiodinium natans TaxID=878477 RepID=A0A812QX66_9DINO|nr:HERC2 [Symbiodinium natans]